MGIKIASGLNSHLLSPLLGLGLPHLRKGTNASTLGVTARAPGTYPSIFDTPGANSSIFDPPGTDPSTFDTAVTNPPTLDIPGTNASTLGVIARAADSSHRMYQSNGFRKLIPPQKRLLNILMSNSQQ